MGLKLINFFSGLLLLLCLLAALAATGFIYLAQQAQLELKTNWAASINLSLQISQLESVQPSLAHIDQELKAKYERLLGDKNLEPYKVLGTEVSFVLSKLNSMGDPRAIVGEVQSTLQELQKAFAQNYRSSLGQLNAELINKWSGIALSDLSGIDSLADDTKSSVDQMRELVLRFIRDENEAILYRDGLRRIEENSNKLVALKGEVVNLLQATRILASQLRAQSKNIFLTSTSPLADNTERALQSGLSVLACLVAYILLQLLRPTQKKDNSRTSYEAPGT